MNINIAVPEKTDGELYDRICRGFCEKYGNDITFSKEIRNDIIGGFIAEVDGTVYDTSISSKLKEIKKVIKG